MKPNKLSSLLEEYKKGFATQRERAEAERLITVIARMEGKLGSSRQVAELIGQNMAVVQRRSRLIGLGDAASPLWERVELDMTLTTAISIATVSRAKSGDVTQNVLNEIRVYDALPCVRRESSGKMTRFAPPTAPPRATVKKKAPKKNTDRGLWDDLRRAARALMAQRFGEGTHEAEQVSTQFEIEFKSLLDGLATSFGDHQRQQRHEKEISARSQRIHLNRACMILGIDPPRKGKAADAIVAARNKKRLVRELHPDLNSSIESTEGYQSVIEAFAVVCRYNSQLEEEKKSCA